MQNGEVTVKQLDELIGQIAELEKVKEAKANELKEINKKLMGLEGRCVQYLTELGRSKYECPHGSFSVSQSWSVGMPATDADKIKFFDYLKSEGLFEKYATVHSQSLNAYYRSEWEKAKKEGRGMEFSLPGIGAPKFFEKLKFKPAKAKGGTE